MKKCPFCGAELQDDSLFCIECGKELPKGIECPHCGTSVNEGDVFCTECGKSLDEVEETVPIQQETPIAEDPVVYKEAGAKRSKLGKYIPFIIAAFVLLGLIGYFSSNASSKDNNDAQVTDSISNEVKGIDNGASYTDEDIKESIESMYKEIFNSNSFGEFDKKYTSSEFYSLYKKALEVDDGEVGIDTDHWVQGQDYDKPSMNVISVKKESDNKAIAKINIRQFEDNDDMTLVKLILLYENGRWVVDDFISLWDGGEEYSEKTSLKNYIREIESKPKEDFSWLQGHWRFEEPNFTGHIIIEGDKITQYSSMNPEKVAYTYRIEGNEIRARIADGMEMAIQIDKNRFIRQMK